VEAGQATPLMPQLRAISNEWLKSKNSREKSFSLGNFDEAYLSHFPIATIEKDGVLVAFANLWPSAGKQEFSADLMRHGDNAPDSVMDYLFTHLLLWGKEQGYRFFDMGMAPLSGLPQHSLASAWNKLGMLVYRRGEMFYNFQGLRQYKEKFDPIWKPRYLACSGGTNLFVAVANIATLISGGVKGIVSK
jgi:phosphatidylglycerol lysyltransferase